MGVNSLPKTVTRQRRDCDLNPGPPATESSTLTTRLPSHPAWLVWRKWGNATCDPIWHVSSRKGICTHVLHQFLTEREQTYNLRRRPHGSKTLLTKTRSLLEQDFFIRAM